VNSVDDLTCVDGDALGDPPARAAPERRHHEPGRVEENIRQTNRTTLQAMTVIPFIVRLSSHPPQTGPQCRDS